MKFSKSLPGYYFFSPQSFVVVAILFFSLCLVENPLGWYKAFGWSGEIDFDIVAIYLFAVILGITLGRVGPSKAPLAYGSFDFSKKWIVIIFTLAALFQIAKFINVGDIPLLGNPLSRYQLSLGGFEDYPTRLLAPLSIAFYFFYKSTGRKVYLCFLITNISFKFTFSSKTGGYEFTSGLVNCCLLS